MTLEERLVTDYNVTGMSIGKHPMAYRRDELNKLGAYPAASLHALPHGRIVRVAGNVIVRQRPGTAKGVMFISLEDETGISNIVVMPDLFDDFRREILTNSWIMAEGKMQNVDNVVHILASRIVALGNPLEIGTSSHDFH